MGKLSFEDYCDDFLNIDASLMTETQRAEALSAYDDLMSRDESKQSKPKKQINQQAQTARDVAKFFGGKALTGTKKQKEWAEKIRRQIIESTTPEAIKPFLISDGVFNSSRFWIDNRDVPAEKWTADQFKKEIRGLHELEEKHDDVLRRHATVGQKDQARKEIKDYIASCSFSMTMFSNWIE